MKLTVISNGTRYRVAVGPKHLTGVSAFAYFAVAKVGGKATCMTPDCPFFHNDPELMAVFAEEICKQEFDYSPIHCAITKCGPVTGEQNVGEDTHG